MKRKRIVPNCVFIARGSERRDTVLPFCGSEVEHKAANLQTKRRPRSRSSRRLEIAPRRLYTCSSRRHYTEYIQRTRTRIMLEYMYSIYYGDTDDHWVCL